MKNNINLSLQNYDALVCGSTSGIGKSTAQELARLGANITLFARNKKKLDIILATLSKTNGQNHTILSADFNEPSQVKKIINDHIKKGNKFEVLINNSGGPKGGPIEKAKTSEFLEAFNRHLICNHIITQALIPNMKKCKYGRIINIISTSVKQPIPELGVSNTIRGAVASWAKTLSFEVAQYGITVNNILPGFTDTERLTSLIEAKSTIQNKSNKEIAQIMKKMIPAGRFGDPQETAQAITFLASPNAGYINGVSLAVDGGRLSSL
jgi:3-oxoacyl-[acyl-carrier protein] reductase